MKNYWYLILLTVILGSISACRVVYRTVLGVDVTIKWMSNEDIAKRCRKYHIPLSQNYLLDTASYVKAIQARYKSDVEGLNEPDSTALMALKSCAKDDGQYVHFRFYDSRGKPLFKIVNCYVTKFVPMTWNVDSCFDFFPPRPLPYLDPALDVDFEFFLPHLTSMKGDTVTMDSLPKADYYAILIWNKFMIKPSRTLIKEVQEYLQIHADKNVTLIYVNNHNQTLWQLGTPEDRKKIKGQTQN